MDELNDRLKSYDNLKLIDIVKNYRQYKYDDSLRNSAIEILKSRGIEENDLKLTGNFENQQYNSAIIVANNYSTYSKAAFWFYAILLISNILAPVINIRSEILGIIFLIIAYLCFFLFFIFLIKSFIAQRDFYKTIRRDLETSDYLVYFSIGMPLYIIMYFYYKQKMKEEMQLIK